MNEICFRFSTNDNTGIITGVQERIIEFVGVIPKDRKTVIAFGKGLVWWVISKVGLFYGLKVAPRFESIKNSFLKFWILVVYPKFQ